MTLERENNYRISVLKLVTNLVLNYILGVLCQKLNIQDDRWRPFRMYANKFYNCISYIIKQLAYILWSSELNKILLGKLCGSQFEKSTLCGKHASETWEFFVYSSDIFGTFVM